MVAIPPLRAASRRRLGLAAAASLLTGLVLALPVLLAGQFGAMARAMFRNLGNSAVASANAHNLWWLVTWGDGWRADTARLLPGLSYRVAGLLLFALCAAWALAILWRKPDDAALLCGAAAFLSFAFFFLTTEVHENWSFALFAPLAAAAALRPAHRPLYAALSATFLLNLALHDPPLRDRLGAGFDGPAHTLGLLNAAANLAIFAWWLWLLARAWQAAASPGSEAPGSAAATTDLKARGSVLRWP